MSDDSIWRPPSDGEAQPPSPPGEPGQPLLPPSGPPIGFEPAGPPVGFEPAAPEPSDASSRSRVGRGALVGAVVAVLLIGAAGVFAATQLLGGDDGGAASPEELGQQVLDAIDDTDLLGLVDLLVPSERDVVRDPLTELVDELRRLDIVSPPAGADGIEGVEFVVERASVRVQPTNVADITNLRLRGDLTVIVDGDALPIGSLLTDSFGDFDRSELDATETEPFDVTLTAVDLDGRWYASVFFSIAEAVRAEQAPPADIPEAGIEPSGGSTPEGALDALFGGVEALDLTRIVAALNPGEASSLQRYAPMFLGAAQDELDLVPLRWEITDTAYTITGSGSTRSATIDRLAIEGRVDGVDFDIVVDGGCVIATADGERFDSCAAGDDVTLDDVIGDSPAARDMVDLIEDVFADYEQPGVTLRQTEGQWYVSPLGTLFDQLLAGLRVLDRADLERLIELAPDAIDEVIGLFVGPFGGDPFTDEDFFDDFLTGDPDVDVDDDDFFDDGAIDDDFFDDDFFDDDFEASAVEECYSLLDVNEALMCFGAALDADEVEEWQVAAEMRFPECGAAEAHWDGYFLMDDAEFIALVEEARPCFLQLVEDGRLESFDVPLAMSDPECFEGRNWFAVFDDPDYDDRFFECVGF
jgi:hypothetical protein